MGGSATMGTNLVDSLNSVVSELRSDLHTQFGVRRYRVHTVLRQWSGVTVGDGSFEDTEIELDPQPLVLPWEGLRYDLEPCGLVETGEVELHEIDMAYTQAELDGGGALEMNQQWLLKISEAHGQLQRPRYFIHAKPPYLDAIKSIGWICWLRRAEG